jgi:hypothetical protein
VEALDPLLIGDQVREGAWVIDQHQAVDVLQVFIAKVALHQGQCDHLNIGELWRGVIRSALALKLRMRFEELVKLAIDFGQVFFYAVHRGVLSPVRVEFVVMNSFYTLMERQDTFLSTFQLNTGV